MFDGTLVKLIKFPAEHLTIFHGTLVFRGTPVENHCLRQQLCLQCALSVNLKEGSQLKKWCKHHYLTVNARRWRTVSGMDLKKLKFIIFTWNQAHFSWLFLPVIIVVNMTNISQMCQAFVWHGGLLATGPQPRGSIRGQWPSISFAPPKFCCAQKLFWKYNKKKRRAPWKCIVLQTLKLGYGLVGKGQCCNFQVTAW